MNDFFAFRTFVSPWALIVFYYLGAAVMPAAAWGAALWFVRRYAGAAEALERGRKKVWDVLTPRQRAGLIFAAVFGFFMMELFWRMMFEFLIAYLQIRDALVG